MPIANQCFHSLYSPSLHFRPVQFPPFVMYYERNGQTRIYGLSASGIDNVTAALNISYRIVKPPDMQWGTKSPEGVYTGMLRDTYLKVRRTLGLAHSIWKTTLSDVYDFVEIGITSGVQDVATGNFRILSAFDLTTWTCLLISVAALSLIIPALRHISTKAEGDARKLASKVASNFWALFSSLVGQGTAAFGDRRSPRYVSGAWLLASLVISTYFTSLIVAALTVHTSFARIDSPEDLVKNPHLTPLVPAGTQVATVLQYAKDGAYRQIQNMVERHQGVRPVSLLYNQKDVEKILQNKAVLLVGKLAAKYELRHYCSILRGRFYISRDYLFVWNSIWAANKDFPLDLFKEINKRIKWWMEAGVPALHSYVLDPPGGSCFAGSQASSVYQFGNLRFEDLTGLFFAHLAALAVATAVCVLELCLGRWACVRSE
ncbi:glutamate receptor ionotropic, delta-2 [Rhipicephalus sanguineus]|uniref:glutamate receptor ionotropic, delta-2 n=1 Tax=Rhipicephalus sanguineus TaxID=34632 RepID=UPI0020C4DDB0|nr:glutamate receptor ionotropic, delta-2 [Rhipicephalus sanguineus]